MLWSPFLFVLAYGGVVVFGGVVRDGDVASCAGQMTRQPEGLFKLRQNVGDELGECR